MSAGVMPDQERVRDLLEGAIGRDELPGALLFTGPHGVGKEEMALALARTLLCTGGESRAPALFAPAAVRHPDRPAGLGGCGACSVCRRILRYSHPDVLVRLPLPSPGKGKREAADPSEALAWKADNPWRDPDVGSGNLGVRVDDVRSLIAELAYPPVEGEHRVIVIREADRMNDAAQNALLKSLEEPPPHTLFILTAAGPESFLPTVRSRCRLVRFSPLPAHVIAGWLTSEEDVDSSRAEEIAVLARGSLKRAIRIAEEGVPGRQEALQLLTWTAGGFRREALGWAADLAFRSSGATWMEARGILEELISLTRDVAVLQSDGRASLLNPDQARTLAAIARQSADGSGLRALEAAQKARGEVDSQVNAALIYAALSNVLFSLSS